MGKGRNISYYISSDDMRRFIDLALKKDDYVSLEASTNTFVFSNLKKDKVKEVMGLIIYQEFERYVPNKIIDQSNK